MQNIDSLIENFINEASSYSKAIPEGDHKKANKANKRMISIYKKINNLDANERLKKYLNHDDDGIRVCTASLLIKDYPDSSISVLTEILKKENIYSLSAQALLDLWKRNQL
jgi:hypothetical protein